MSKKESNYPPKSILEKDGRNDNPPNKQSGQKKKPKLPSPPPPPPKYP